MGRVGRMGERAPTGLTGAVAAAGARARPRDTVPPRVGAIAGGRDTRVTAFTRVTPTSSAKAPFTRLGRVGLSGARVSGSAPAATVAGVETGVGVGAARATAHVYRNLVLVRPTVVVGVYAANTTPAPGKSHRRASGIAIRFHVAPGPVPDQATITDKARTAPSAVVEGRVKELAQHPKPPRPGGTSFPAAPETALAAT